VQLILPNPAYEESYKEYIQELGDEVRYPFPLDFDHSDFSKLLEKLDSFKNGTGLPEGFVPATTYWLVEDGELIGVSNLRHYLNDWLRHAGGHIGLGIRPSYRGKGLGSLLLRLSVEKAVELGIKEAHVYCHKGNEPSARMIRANGGELESEIEDDGEIIQRYVVNAP
tara:strand:- start:1592 stop:2095 length:504 start_codon:yes stop_codon:yes gene_type:complete